MSRFLLRSIAVAAFATFFLNVSGFAQQSPRDKYERARMLDESNQNLPEAIKLYTQVVSLAKDQPKLAAQAQYHIGLLYQRLGRKADAQQAFRSVVAQYPDQKDLAGLARARIIPARGNGKNGKGIEIKRTGPSPDGQFLATFTFPPYVFLSRPVIDEQRHRLYLITKPQTPGQENERLPPGTRKVGGTVYWPSALVVIDTRTLAITKTVPFPVHLGGIAVSSINNKLYMSEFVDGQVRVIDSNTFATLTKIPAPGYPGEPLYNPVTNKIYVASQGFPGNDRLSIIDPLTNSIARTVGVEGGVSGVVINSATNRIYVKRDQSTRVLNGEDGSVIADLPEMSVVSADPVNNRVYAAQVSGYERPALLVLDGDTHGILATLPHKDVSYNDGIDTHDRISRIYIAQTATNQIVVLDSIGHREINRVSIRYPAALTADRMTGNVYVCYQQIPQSTTLGVLSKEALEEKSRAEFFDEFDGPELDPAWTAPGGRSSYSLTENPGSLRFSISGPSNGPRLAMARKFRGEYWTFEMKVSYFMSTIGGGRGPHFILCFDEPKYFTNPFACANGIHLVRYRNDWDGCCPGEMSAYFAEQGGQFSVIRELPSAADAYSYRIKRDHRTVTIERSDDGINFALLASRTFESHIDGHNQHLVFGYNSHGANDGHVDIDYVRLSKKTPIDPTAASTIKTERREQRREP